MEMDENLKRDIRLIEMRNYIDPKRFYKKTDKIGQILHVGTGLVYPRLCLYRPTLTQTLVNKCSLFHVAYFF